MGCRNEKDKQGRERGNVTAKTLATEDTEEQPHIQLRIRPQAVRVTFIQQIQRKKNTKTHCQSTAEGQLRDHLAGTLKGTLTVFARFPCGDTVSIDGDQ